MEERLKNNIAILKRHNLTHEPVYHITDRKKHEVELIDEIVEDCEAIFNSEEQGLIKGLPCKVGDTLYRVDIGGNVVQGEVGMLQCLKDGRWKFRFIYKLRSYNSKSSYHEYCDEIGKTYFLTYKEVEKKLKELKGKSYERENNE